MKERINHADRIVRGKKIKAARQRKGLTQTQLAILCNCERGVVWEWERGNYDPHLEAFALICAALEIDANEMLGLCGTPAAGDDE